MLLNYVAITFGTALVLTIAIEFIAPKLGVVSKTSYRRKKIEHTPLLGGGAIFLAAAMGFILVEATISWSLILAFLPLLAFGIVDDAIEVGGRWKLTAQLASAMLWLAFIPKDQMMFFELTSIGWLASGLTLAFLIGTTNAYNLIDGLDGQAGTLAIIAWFALSLTIPHSPIAWVMIAATAGFLLRNLYPARIYLGEVGGSLLGFTLGAMTVLKPASEVNLEYFIALLFLFSLPFSDTVAAIGRRIYRGQSVFHGDREHVHHRLLKLQLNVPQTQFVTALLGGCGAMTYVLSSKLNSPKLEWLLFAISGLLMSLIFIGVLYFERTFSQRVLGLGRGLLQKRLAGRFPEHVTLAPSRAILIDLLPYFRELQSEGVLTLHEFLDDLAKVISKSKAKRVEFVGSYSVALLFDDLAMWSGDEMESFANGLYDLFRKFHCVRSMSPIPEGVTFCNQNRIPALLSIFEAPLPTPKKKAS